MRRRKASAMSLAPLEWPDIASFAQMSGMSLSSLDIGYLELIDDQYIAAQDAGPTPAEEQLALVDSAKRMAGE